MKNSQSYCIRLSSLHCSDSSLTIGHTLLLLVILVQIEETNYEEDVVMELDEYYYGLLYKVLIAATSKIFLGTTGVLLHQVPPNSVDQSLAATHHNKHTTVIVLVTTSNK